MKEKDLTSETYLDPNFDYKKLTKLELKKILFENNVNVRSNALKQELLDNYKTNIYDKIDEIKLNKKREIEKMNNIYQSGSSIVEIDLNDNRERVKRNSASGRPVKKNEEVITPSKKKPISLNEKLAHIKNKPKDEKEEETSFVEEDKQNRKNIFSNVYEKKPEAKEDKPQAKEVKSEIRPDIKEKPTQFKPEVKEKYTQFKEIKPDMKDFKPQVKPEVKEKFPHAKEIKEETNISHKNFMSSTKDQNIEPEEKIQIPKMRKNTEIPNKELLKSFIEEDMKKNSSRRLSTSNECFNSSFSAYDGTAFQSKISTAPKSKKGKYFFLFILFFLIVGVFLAIKQFPYNNGKCFFCVNVPFHGKIIGNNLICDKGYIFKKSIFGNYCMKDNSKIKKIEEIVSKLEFKHGDYKYGRCLTPYLNIKDLTKNEELLNELKDHPKIIIQDNKICTKTYKISLRTFSHFYFKKIFFISMPILFLICLVKYIKYKLKLKREIEIESKKISKDVLNVLLRQLIISTNNSRFPEYVYIDQLKDVFGENRQIWNAVVNKVTNNSNVSTLQIENKEAWQWIGPIMRRKESIENIVI
ncbi:putative inner nuclear membrane protein SRC1 [Vairimorpha necatrix]|uniref:Inner nuclear membrane protein SRC1 n=1 Tax=Vairimorpha necatrix TaxID=6039 RepID=A0AAX4JFZ6_9MICR